MPNEGCHCTCLSVVFDSVFRMGKNYYSQVFLEECKYVVKEKEVNRHITEELVILRMIQVNMMKDNYPLINAQKGFTDI